eukprot:8741351-Pyramimonas_sp.AAC.1
MGVVGKLLAKKTVGQFRVIGLICMICRVWSLAREPVVQSWATSSQPDGDAAVKGNSALREAYMKALNEELYTRLKMANGHALMDIQ